MRVLDLRLKGGKAVRELPMIQGLPVIGKGSFASVFDRGSSIVKVTADRFQYDFHCAKITNPAFPKVLLNYGQVGEVGGFAVYMIEMEKLQRIVPDSNPRCFVKRFIKEFYRNYPCHGAEVSNSQCCAEALALMSDDESFTGRLRSGLVDLAGFVLDKRCVSDFHTGNFMVRGNGEIVLNDPVADSYADKG